MRFLSCPLAAVRLPIASNSWLAVSALAWNGLSPLKPAAKAPTAKEAALTAPAGRGLSLARFTASPKRRGGGHGDSTAKVALACKFSVATGAKRCALARCPLLCCFRVMRGRQAWPAAWAELFTIAKTAGEAAAVNTCSNKFVLSSARRENLEGAHGSSSEKRPGRSKVTNLEPKWPQMIYVYLFN